MKLNRNWRIQPERFIPTDSLIKIKRKLTFLSWFRFEKKKKEIDYFEAKKNGWILTSDIFSESQTVVSKKIEKCNIGG
jgi:hypothetical protein